MFPDSHVPPLLLLCFYSKAHHGLSQLKKPPIICAKANGCPDAEAKGKKTDPSVLTIIAVMMINNRRSRNERSD